MKKRILIIDDDLNLGKTLADILSVKGYLPFCVGTGKKALEKIEKEMVPVALIDIRLDGMSGLDVMKQIKECSPATECIVITGHGSQALAIEAMNLGAYSYVLKPYSMDLLLLTLERAIEKQKTREALRESQEKYKALYDNAPLSYQSLDDDGCFIDVNPMWLKTLGYAREEIIGKNFGSFLHPDWKPHFVKNFPAFKERGYVNDAQFKIQHKDGHYLDISFEGCIGYHPNGIFKQTYCVFKDITENKQAEAALRESEERFRDISHSMADWIWETDKNGKYTFLSQSGNNFLGYSLEELIGKTLFEVIPREEGTAVRDLYLENTSKSKPIHDIESWHIAKDGTKVCLLTNGVPIRDANGALQGYRGVNKDITSQKKLEQELLQSQKMEAIGTLAGGIAHDFNNILSGILGYSQIIKQQVAAESSVGKDIREVLRAGKRAVDLVKQILTLSRKTDTEKQPLQPHLIVKEALKMLRSILPTTIHIEQNIDPECGLVLANSTHIHQITVNLCTNALHAMEDEKGTLIVNLQRKEVRSSEIDVGGVSSGPFVVLTISDTGCGMDEETISRIFEPYFTTKEAGRGTGLGLAVIHGIVQDNRGVIRVKSTPGEGSSFAVYLPVFKKENFTGHDSDKKTIPLGGTEHILVVDDELLIVRATQRQLENVGYRVTASSDSKEALEKILSGPEQFDLLITDQTMPGMTGSELTLAVRKVKPDMPVILCTGHSDLVSKEKALAAGIDKYVTKPIAGNELFQVVRSVLDGLR